MGAFSLERDKSKPSVASPDQALFVPALQQSEKLSLIFQYFILNFL